jgi:aconitate hydratase
MIGAGLLAKKAVERGLDAQAVGEDEPRAGLESRHRLFLEKAGLTPYLDKLGFNLVGYGCTTCIGNSGPLPDDVARVAVAEHDMIVAAVLSGNRNFEGRIHPQVRANYLASPPLVVAYALAGRMDVDLTTEPLGTGSDGKPVFLREIWPSNAEIDATIGASVHRKRCSRALCRRFHGRRELARAAGPDGRALRLGSEERVRQEAAVLRRHAARAGGRDDITARARSRCSATASRPITSRPPARSRRSAPRRSI